MASTTLKQQLWQQLRQHLSDELASMTDSQRVAQRGATHTEAKPEHAKDTRALEQTYLARGLAGRVAELKAGVAAVEGCRPRPFDKQAPISLTALVTIAFHDNDREQLLLVAPAGGGLRLQADKQTVHVVTPKSPLGRAVVGARLDDEGELHGPTGARRFDVVAVC